MSKGSTAPRKWTGVQNLDDSKHILSFVVESHVRFSFNSKGLSRSIICIAEQRRLAQFMCHACFSLQVIELKELLAVFLKLKQRKNHASYGRLRKWLISLCPA
jgi:hypothetical protein